MDEDFMREAIVQAGLSAKKGEIPIGAVLVKDGRIISRAHNEREASQNPLAHAEMVVLHEAGKSLGSWRLLGAHLYVTLEPCPMCLGALLQARVERLIFGCTDDKRNSVDFLQESGSVLTFPSLNDVTELRGNNHCVGVTKGVCRRECQRLIQDFFRYSREFL